MTDLTKLQRLRWNIQMMYKMMAFLCLDNVSVRMWFHTWTVPMLCKRIHEQYEQISPFGKRRSIGLKEAKWLYRKNARYLSRKYASVRRCWQELWNHGPTGCLEISGPHRQ
ncbi:hypothetical protein TNCV_4003601 [Trichonephila clavipes]|nr:hypothetical protein TNCV_4003601 [Trichonephila clavipes]